MDESIRRMLLQHGTIASNTDAIESARRALGPVSTPELADVMRLQEIDRLQTLYGNLSSAAASNALGSIGYIKQYASAADQVSDQIARTMLNAGAIDQIPETVRAAIEGRLMPGVLENSLRSQMTVLDDLSIKFGAVGASSLAAFASDQSHWQRGLSDLASDMRMSQSGLETVGEAIRAQNSVNATFRLTQANEIASLVDKVIRADRLTAYAFADSLGQNSLISRIGAMEMPWLKISDRVQSVAAFAHVQAIGDIVQSAPPFAAEVATWLRTDLGDWRDTVATRQENPVDLVARTQLYVDQGFNRTLTDFTPRAFHRCIAIARLTEVDWEDVDDWCTAGSDELDRNKAAFDRIQRFEMAMRRFITVAMTVAFGDDWMVRQLPSSMLDSWKQKQQSAVKAGAEARPLIDYADFTDYLPIIERRDNWSRVFKAIFGRQEDIKESLQRLYPVRLATMHSRGVTLDDTLLLIVESKRVVRAFGRY